MVKKLINKTQLLEEKLPGFSRWALDYRIRTRSIPMVKIGGNIYFEVESIDKWINENLIESKEVSA